MLLRNKEAFKFWKELGVTQIFLGLEAIDEEGLRKYRKRLVAISRHSNLLARWAFTWPSTLLPIRTGIRSDSDSSAIWCMDVPEVVNISINTPYPGTETWLTEQRRLQTRDYRLFDIQHAVLPTKLPLDVFYRELLDTQWVLYRKHLNWRTTPKLARVLARKSQPRPSQFNSWDDEL